MKKIPVLDISMSMDGWEQLTTLSRLIRNTRGNKQLAPISDFWIGVYLPKELVSWLKDNSLANCKTQITRYLTYIRLITESDCSSLVEIETQDELEADPELEKMAKFFRTLEPSKELLIDKLTRKYKRELSPPRFLSKLVARVSFTGTLVFADEMGIVRKDEVKIWRRAYQAGKRIVGFKRPGPAKPRKKEISLETQNEIEELFQPIGRIVIIRSGNSRNYGFLYFSIGQTEDSVETKVQSLQQGNPQAISVIGEFETRSRKTLNHLAKLFAERSRGSGWFSMKAIEVKRLLSDNWRKKKGLF